MRLWEIRILRFLPQSQLIAQKRECDLMFRDYLNGKKTNHILINYVWNYPIEDLIIYYKYIKYEFNRRNIKFNTKYIEQVLNNSDLNTKYLNLELKPFVYHHTDNYLLQCYFNLEEKYMRSQKDFDRDTYLNLWNFVNAELNGLLEKIRLN
jgi:uncharacterized protein (TIGR02328 family)